MTKAKKGLSTDVVDVKQYSSVRLSSLLEALAPNTVTVKRFAF